MHATGVAVAVGEMEGDGVGEGSVDPHAVASRTGASRSQAERVMNTMDVVKREEFEAVRDMAIKARDENERLSRRIAELEAKLQATGAGSAS